MQGKIYVWPDEIKKMFEAETPDTDPLTPNYYPLSSKPHQPPPPHAPPLQLSTHK